MFPDSNASYGSRKHANNRALLATRYCVQISFLEKVMSQNRFQTDSLRKLENLLDYFKQTMKRPYIPDQDLPLDEPMVLWRGQLVFCQYIKNKRHKYGNKFYELCDLNDIALRVSIYCAITCRSSSLGWNCSYHCVPTEIYFILHKDNLWQWLLQFSFTYKPTVNFKMQHLWNSLCWQETKPQSFCASKIKEMKSNGIVACKWEQKREALVVNNKHKVERVDVVNKHGAPPLKLNIAKDYNLRMSEIDWSDQLLLYYDVSVQLISAVWNFTLKNRRKDYLTDIQRSCYQIFDWPGNINRSSPHAKTGFHYIEELPLTKKKARPTKPCRNCS